MIPTHVQIARSLLNVPWLHQGRDPDVGIDCVGLLTCSFRTADDTVYGRNPSHWKLQGRLEHHFGKPVDAPVALGDVALFGFGRAGAARHVGIVGNHLYGGLSIIHTDSVVGRVVEHALDDKWLRRIRGVYRP